MRSNDGAYALAAAMCNGSRPASSVLVIFWHDRDGRPHWIAGRQHSLFCAHLRRQRRVVQCVLPTRGKHNTPVVRLRAGTSWVSVIANCDSFTCGTWSWRENTTATGSNQTVWKNPGHGFTQRCSAWIPLSTCFGGSPAELAFNLIGLSKPVARKAAHAAEEIQTDPLPNFFRAF